MLFIALDLAGGVFFKLFMAKIIFLLFLLLLWETSWGSFLKSTALYSIIFAFGYFFTSTTIILPESETQGRGRLSISSIQPITTFNKGYLIKGYLKNFQDLSKKYKNIPCSIYLPAKAKIACDCDYFVEGKIVKKPNFRFTFKPDKNSLWQKIPNTFSLAENRFFIKQKLHGYLAKNFSSNKVQNFLKGVIEGEIDDPLLMYNFLKTGLAHILVISGMHFVLITNIFSLFFWFMSPAKKAILLLIVINFYFFFVGITPSISRAYISSSIALCATIFSKQNFILNALGTALVIQIITNPLVLTNVGLQLSYFCVLSILLIHPLIESRLFFLIKKREYDELRLLPLRHKPIGRFLNFLREAFSLSLAVNLSTLPIILFYFHKFPLASFIYNLYFPLLFSLSIFLFFVGFFLFFLFPPLGSAINFLNSCITKFFLDMVASPPATFLYWFRLQNLTSTLVIVYSIFLFSLAALALYMRKEKFLIPEIFRTI